MTADRNRAEKSVSDLAGDRIDEATDRVAELNSSKAFDSVPKRQNHAQEFQQQALALLSDASEALENGDYAAVIRLLKPVTTFLEAIQDLLVEKGEYKKADALGQAIDVTRQAKTLLNVYTT